ncbi:MAG: alpha/beta hydrolase [Bdellovibrionales bacterium]|nr:alpha/beta hydrolase [Bdellovibrionales bacterium]
MKTIEKRTGTFTSFDNTEIYYEVRGQGRPLVFAYGIGCLINHWHFQIEALSHNYQTIVFDYRAHHKSGSPDDLNNLTTEAIAKDMLLLLDHLEIKSAAFLAHSFGGQVLVKGHQLDPKRFDLMIFVNGFASNPIVDMYGSNFSEKLFHKIKNGFEALPSTVSYLWKIVVDNPIAARVSALAGGFNFHLTKFNDIEIYLKGISSISLEAFLFLFEDMMNFDGRDHLDKIKIPVLIIGGEKDSITPLSYQHEMEQKLEKSEFLAIPYGSHCTQLDFPDYVNLRIEKFLIEHEYLKLNV